MQFHTCLDLFRGSPNLVFCCCNALIICFRLQTPALGSNLLGAKGPAIGPSVTMDDLSLTVNLVSACRSLKAAYKNQCFQMAFVRRNMQMDIFHGTLPCHLDLSEPPAAGVLQPVGHLMAVCRIVGTCAGLTDH